MRDLSALQVYSIDEFERAKFARVPSAEVCAQEEEKMAEIRNVISDIKTNKAEYKNDRAVDRIIGRLECALNFLTKASSAFSVVANQVAAKRKDLEERRIENQKALDENKAKRDLLRGDASNGAKKPEEAVAVKRRGRPKKMEGAKK